MWSKVGIGGEHHRYYNHTKFHQNPRGDPKFLVDLTRNDPHGSGISQILNCPPQSTLTPAQLLPESELTLIFMKSCSRRNMCVHLTRQLFTKQVRKTSNVSGRNKQKLDQRIIHYIKSTAFKYFPSQNTDVSKEWADCIISIDESCRRLCNKPTKKQLKGLQWSSYFIFP